MRITIPSTVDIKIKGSVIWKMMKDLIGKDLSKFSLPVFINEPCTVLMKGAEYGFYCDLITKAAKEQNAHLRLLNLAVSMLSVFNQV